MAYSPGSAPRIFISHSSKDNYFGLKLVTDLRHVLGNESAVWYDSAGGLFGGDNWWSKIEKELTVRDTFIILLSPDAMKSKWVRREYDIALNEEKRIIPVRCRESDTWIYLKTLHIISFVDAKYYQTAFKELLDALGLPSGGTPLKPRPRTPETTLLEQMAPQIEQAFKVQDWSNVIDKVEDIVNKAPGMPTSTLYHRQGVAFFKERKWREAAEALHSALSLVSNREERLKVMQDYAAVLNAEGQWTELLALAEEALQLVPKNQQWWYTVQKKAQDELAKEPHQQCGAYRLTQLLSQRTLGKEVLSEMYVGEHISQKTIVMVKLLNVSIQGNAREQFLSEASIIAGLIHPNIAHIIDFGVQKDTPFLVIDSIPRKSLRQRHPPGIKLQRTTIKSYVKQVASALQYAHGRNVFHGSLMPENMLVGANQEILLIDFHIASIAQRMQRMSYSIYMAPEQLEGQPGPATDQYALAVAVYEWLIGNQPSASDLTFMDKSMHDLGILPSSIREQNSNISPAIEKALMRALNKDPHRRYSHIEDFANDLENAL